MAATQSAPPSSNDDDPQNSGLNPFLILSFPDWFHCILYECVVVLVTVTEILLS